MVFKRKRIPDTPYAEMSLSEVIKEFLISKLPRQKEKISTESINAKPQIKEDEINHIAIVLDGVVEDVMRAQNRLAALLLSNPDFVEFDPTQDRPQIGETLYKDGKFINPLNQLMTDEEIESTLKKMGAVDED